MIMLLKAICRFNAIPVKIPMAFFQRTRTNNSKICMLLLLLSHFSRVRLCVTPWRQPTRLCCPWDSPGKNTGEGCHFLRQCMKVKSESEVAQSCLLATPWTEANQAPPSMGFSRQEYWSGVPLPSPYNCLLNSNTVKINTDNHLIIMQKLRLKRAWILLFITVIEQYVGKIFYI